MSKSILAAMVLCIGLSGCAGSNGYYANQSAGGSSYSDPDFCKGGAICPLIIGGAIVGAAIALSH
jgi:hypothetical protein